MSEEQPVVDAPGFQTTFLQLPRLRVHAAVAGPVDGPLVLLLHGFPEFWYSWRRQIGPLARAGFRVVAPDQRGYNLTERRPPYRLEVLTRDAIDVVRALGREDAFVVGHDWGAAVAWTLAGRHPRVVRRLAILNVPHWAAMDRALRFGNPRQMLRSWYIAFFQLPRLPEWLLSRDDFAPLARAMRGTARPDAFGDDEMPWYRRAWARPGALSAMIGWYRTMVRAVATGTDPDPRVRVEAPTLVLWGERDVALEVALAEESMAWVDDGRLERFPEATHWLHLEEPDVVADRLIDHFTGQERRTIPPIPGVSPQRRSRLWTRSVQSEDASGTAAWCSERNSVPWSLGRIVR